MITIYLGKLKEKIVGKLSRDANQNSTPRIYGKNELQNWFQKNFKLKDIVSIYIISKNEIWIKE
jgi:hypothetical protein